MPIKTIALASAAIWAVAAAMPAAAAPAYYGAGSWSTARNCSTTAPTDPCGGTLPGQQIFTANMNGGANVAVSNAALSLPDGSYAESTAGFGALDMPELHGESASSATTRMNSNSIAYKSFTYNGTTGTPFALDGVLTFSTSGSLGTGDPNSIPGQMPGEGLIGTYLAIWDISTVASVTTAQDIFNTVFYAPCGQPGVIGAATLGSAPGASGAASLTVTLSQGCDGNPLSLTNGGTFLIVAGMQTPSNRGGFADAANTFVVGLSNTLDEQVRNEIAGNLESALDVPEPAMLGLFGFGAISLGIGRRRKA